MRTFSSVMFHETVNYCFNLVLESMGADFRDTIYELLEQKGLKREEVSTRFGDVIKLLTESLGTSARVLIFKTVEELYRDYSIRTELSYNDAPMEKITLIQSRVEAEHLHPKHLHSVSWNSPSR